MQFCDGVLHVATNTTISVYLSSLKCRLCKVGLCADWATSYLWLYGTIWYAYYASIRSMDTYAQYWLQTAMHSICTAQCTMVSYAETCRRLQHTLNQITM